MGDRLDPLKSIAHLAAAQYGHATRLQLRTLGIAPGTIDGWVAGGHLVVVHHGVYAVAYRRVEPVARAMAAVLAAGPFAVLSHDSALALWGLRRWPPEPEVISPHRVRRPGIVGHRSTTLTEADTTVQLGVPTTRAARAIADLGTRLTARQRIRLTNDARLAHVLSSDEAQRLLGHGRHATRSHGEDALHRWIEQRHIRRPLTEVDVNGHAVDALWPDEGVIVELDHPATHSDPDTFRADRRRDRENRELGYQTVRLTAEDLTAAEARRLKRLLDRRRRRSPPPTRDPPAC